MVGRDSDYNNTTYGVGSSNADGDDTNHWWHNSVRAAVVGPCAASCSNGPVFLVFFFATWRSLHPASGEMPAGHHIRFDLPFLKRWVRRNGLPLVCGQAPPPVLHLKIGSDCPSAGVCVCVRVCVPLSYVL